MKNLYAKKCCWCKVVVQPGEGRLWNYNDKWWVGCQSCLDEKFGNEDKGDQLPYFFDIPLKARYIPCLIIFVKFIFKVAIYTICVILFL